MDVELGARVVTAEGAEVGRIHRVVVDLEQQAVTALVVLKGGLLARDVLVPLDFVDHAEANTVTLRLRRAELGHLPDFASNTFFTPPPTWALPLVYPGGAVYIPVSQRQRMSPTQEDLTPGMHVRARDGDLGVIDRIELNDLGHLVALWVQPAGAHQELRIPVEWIETIDDLGVTVDKTRREAGRD